MTSKREVPTSSYSLLHFNRRNDEKMVLKTWEILLKFHNLIGIFLVVLVTVALYITDDFTYRNAQNEQVGYFREEKDASHNDSLAGCDLFSGRWIFDSFSHPMYEEKQCSFLEDSFACETHGRKDLKYRHWRWQPHHCNLLRFNGRALLEKLRGKKLVFVGDSLNRNQWISFLCMIESSLPKSSNKTLVLNGNFYFLHDTEYNATIGFYWSPFLVESNCDDMWNHRVEGRVIRVESIEKHARHWNDADILIFNSHSWWLNPTLTILWGSFGSPNAIYKTVEMKQRRYEMALSTWSNWLEFNINRNKTKLFFMSLSPYIFRNDVVRHCYNKSEPLFIESYWNNKSMMSAAESAIKQLEARGVKVEYLRITEMSEYRVDGHPSIYRKFHSPLSEETRKNPVSYSDCLHWCLPGVPDVWNQILYAYIMKS